MKMFTTGLFRSKVTALLVTLVSFACTAYVSAQTTFSLASTNSTLVTGAAAYSNTTLLGGIYNVGSSFSYVGTTSGLFTPETIGQSFMVKANGTSTQAGTAAWAFSGTSTGAFSNNTVLPISYSFTIDKNAGITSDVTWSLYFQGGSNSAVQLANGTLTGAINTFSSSSFSGSVVYNYATGASASDTVQTYLEVAFTTNVAAMGQPIVNVTMQGTSFGGQGITLGTSAVPEPSTYAAIAIAGAAVLGFAGWHRRRRPTSAATLNVGAAG